MKRIFFFALFCTTYIITSAQNWVSTDHKPDELAGTKAYTSYMYTDSIGNIFVYWSNSNADFRIVCAKGIFDFFVDDQGRYLTRCKVGFYDKIGHMIEDKTVLMRVVPGNAGQAEMYFPMGDFGANKRKAKKILDFIMHNDGHIRFLAELHGGGYFDLEIPCTR